MDPFHKRVKHIFLSKFSQTSFMAFQMGTEKSLDGIADYFIRFSLCKKIRQKFLAPLPGTEEFFGGNKRSLAHTDLIIFLVNKFLASLPGI